ncbi:hypothetical protein ACQ4N7_29095 [Nodosilinea sp. AN01ver1]|uniref:hypothetical protein n=1 Tax=Nodosilinea sp. AN01ver1 TaxID=3423362 RepID=UPI003D323377
MTWYNPFSLTLALVGAATLNSGSLPQPVAAQTPEALAPEFASVWDFFRREADDRRAGRDGSPRGPLCSITPGEETVWNRTPLFVWQGASSIGLRQPHQDILWQETATTVVLKEDERELYQSYRPTEALEPGRYEWLFFIVPSQHAAWNSFEVMDDDTYKQIAAELETLEASLAAENADAETIALARMSFFAERNLASDALQELFAVADPSPAIQQRQAEVVERFCSEESKESDQAE